MVQLLLVDDDLSSYEIVKRALGNEIAVTGVASLAEARQALEARRFDLILLDVMLPDGDGFKFCASLKTEPGMAGTDVVFITGKTAIDDKVVGFAVGGDDYLSKPFHPLELRARVASLVKRRRARREEGDFVSLGSLRLDLGGMRASATVGGGEVQLGLTPMEFKLLVCLARHPAQVLSREQLLEAAWADQGGVYDRTVDAHLCKLRKKLKPSLMTIEALYGVGYRLATLHPESGSRARAA